METLKKNSDAPTVHYFKSLRRLAILVELVSGWGSTKAFEFCCLATIARSSSFTKRYCVISFTMIFNWFLVTFSPFNEFQSREQETRLIWMDFSIWWSLSQTVRGLDLVPIVMIIIYIYIWTSVHEEKVLEDKVPKSMLAIFFNMVNWICSKWRPQFFEPRIKSVLVLQLSGSTFSEQKWEKICPSNHFFMKKPTITTKNKQPKTACVKPFGRAAEQFLHSNTNFQVYLRQIFNKTFWSTDTPPMRQNWLAKPNM